MGALCSSLARTERPLATPTQGTSYDDLPLELQDLVIAGLHDPADRARARAVCRSWHAAVRRHTSPQQWRLPSPMTLTFWRRLHSLPHRPKTVGSTDDWLAVRLSKKRITTKDGQHSSSYILLNPFFNKTVPLPELEAVMGNHESEIYKFLMRSGVDDLIAVITDNEEHTFMVIRPGKGVWLPPPQRTRPYIYIIDIAFLQGKLYAITMGEDLVPFDLALDGEGIPVVTMGKRLIKQPPYYNGYGVWKSDDDDCDDDNGDDDDNEEDENNEEEEEEEEENVAAAPNEAPNPYGNRIFTRRHLIVSCGKLLMVRHHQQMNPSSGVKYLTLGVEVFEADTDTGAWMPLTGGLGGGRALFISLNFSKSVAAPCGEVEEDVIYFMDTGKVFNLKYGTSTPSRLCESFGQATWLFHPELVV